MVPDPQALKERLRGADARPGFTGLMLDRRYDRDGRLFRRDEVLRLRVFRSEDGHEEARLGWKGPTIVTAQGHKSRKELEYRISGETESPEALLEALGYTVSHKIDRFVEQFMIGDTTVRLEWYPRMDVLVEIEGPPEGIEFAVAATGLPRTAFSPESLNAFAQRFEQRAGKPALLSLDAAGGEVPSWQSR